MSSCWAAPLMLCTCMSPEGLQEHVLLQVRDYYYRLKAQFQKHNPSRDVNTLMQKELIHAMTSMWAAVSHLHASTLHLQSFCAFESRLTACVLKWSNGQGQKPKLLPQKSTQANAAKMARYSLIMQEVNAVNMCIQAEAKTCCTACLPCLSARLTKQTAY